MPETKESMRELSYYLQMFALGILTGILITSRQLRSPWLIAATISAGVLIIATNLILQIRHWRISSRALALCRERHYSLCSRPKDKAGVHIVDFQGFFDTMCGQNDHRFAPANLESIHDPTQLCFECSFQLIQLDQYANEP